MEKLLRVHKLDLEGRLGAKISVKHTIFAWLVEHIADLLNRFAVGSDGKTAVQRLKGKSCEQCSVEFATHVMFRVCGRVDGALMTERWLSGVWLGMRLGTEEHVVMRDDGVVVRARAIREVDRKITLEKLGVLTGQPHDPMGTMKAGGDRDGGRRADQEPAGEGEIFEKFTPKRVQITKEVVKRFGPTEGCRKCRGVLAGDNAYKFVHHSETCRSRLEEMMKEDEHFKMQVENAERRQVERIAEVLERKDKAQKLQAEQEAQIIKKRKTEQQTGLIPGGASGTSASSSSSPSSSSSAPLAPTSVSSASPTDPRSGEVSNSDVQVDLEGDTQMQDDMGIPLATPSLMTPGKRVA